jgi:hypothetical protein
MFKKGSTLVLRAAVIAMGLVVVALGVFALPSIWTGVPQEYPVATFAVHSIVIGMYATMIPFYFTLWQTMKLLRYIDTNIAFSDLSVRALQMIKYSAGIVGAMYLGGLPFLLPIAEADDAPGLLIIGFVFACTPVAIAVFAAVLKRLLQNAIDMKSENELTV